MLLLLRNPGCLAGEKEKPFVRLYCASVPGIAVFSVMAFLRMESRWTTAESRAGGSPPDAEQKRGMIMRLGQGGHGNYAASSPMDSIGAVAEAGARGSCIPGCSVEVEGLRFLQLPRCVDWIGDCWECSNRATSRSTQHVPPLSNNLQSFLSPSQSQSSPATRETHKRPLRHHLQPHPPFAPDVRSSLLPLTGPTPINCLSWLGGAT